MDALRGLHPINTNVRTWVCKFLPIFQWLPNYGVGDIFGDFVAGLSVSMTAIPQSIAYAILAGIAAQYGLYSSFLAPFVYIFLGSCRQVTIGPTAVTALLAYETCGPKFPDCVVLVAFYSGIVQFLFVILRLGKLVALISDPVTLGFTTGAAFTIASSQLKNFFGLAPTSSTASSGFIGYVTTLITNWQLISLPDMIMGLSCIVALFALQNLSQIFKCGNLLPLYQQDSTLSRVLSLISVTRNVTVVVAASIIALTWPAAEVPFKLTGYVEPGLPNLSVPKFCLANHWINSTEPSTVLSFTATLGKIGFAPVLVAVVAILQNIAITKAYGTGQRVDGNQEMLTLGVVSILGGFISAQPVSASFSRSALNQASGVRSQFAGFFTGSIIVISLLFLTPGFFYIPKATLAAVVIAAISSMINLRILKTIWNISKIDVLAYLVTFCTSILLNMEVGIGAGVGFSILVFLYNFLSAKFNIDLRPTDGGTTDEEEDGLLQQQAHIILRPPQGLHFPDVDILRKYINKCQRIKTGATQAHPIIVLDCATWWKFDYTGAAAIASLLNNSTQHTLILLNSTLDFRTALTNLGINQQLLNQITCESELDLNHVIRKLIHPVENVTQNSTLSE